MQLYGLPASLRVIEEGGSLSILVPRDEAERLQSYLREHGLRSTVCWDAREEEARLQLWPGADTETAVQLLREEKAGAAV